MSVVVSEADKDLAAWLANATGDTAAHVLAELALGDRRRAFVLRELADAGFVGAELVGLLVRLTGVDVREARIAVEAHEQEHRSDPPRRDARLAENEIRFREHNEEIARLARHEEPPKVIDLVCECSDSTCTRTLSMPFAEYEWLRQDPVRFVVLPGHEAPAVEDAIERHDAYVVVVKHSETHQQVAAADPRS